MYCILHTRASQHTEVNIEGPYGYTPTSDCSIFIAWKAKLLPNVTLRTVGTAIFLQLTLWMSSSVPQYVQCIALCSILILRTDCIARVLHYSVLLQLYCNVLHLLCVCLYVPAVPASALAYDHDSQRLLVGLGSGVIHVSL